MATRIRLIGVVLVLAVMLAGCQAPALGTTAATPSTPQAQRVRPTRAPSATPAPTVTPTSEPTATATSLPATTPTATQPPATATPEPAAPANTKASGTSYAGKLAVRAADGVIYVVNADHAAPGNSGTDLHALTTGVDPSWSPDGERLAFVRWWEPWGLFTINADGAGERQLIADKDLRQPAWSPNGDVIAVVKNWLETVTSRRPGSRSVNGPPPPPGDSTSQETVGVLKGVNPDTGAYYDGDYPADQYARSPSWAPDSVHLVFEGELGLNITAKGEDPFLLTPDLQDSVYATPAWSPQGDRIAYTREMHGYWEIWSMNTDGSDRRQLTAVSAPGGAPAYNNVCPAWSPDGGYIAFLTDRSGEWEVWVMRADGSDQHRLLDLPMELTYGFNGDRLLDWGR